jgi:hypothetical protein
MLTAYRTGDSLLTLGVIQEFQGRITEAMKTYHQAWKLLKATLGEHHHRTADACYKIGSLLHSQRKYGNAM